MSRTRFENPYALEAAAGTELAVGMDDALVDLDRLVVEAHLHFAPVRIDAGVCVRVACIAQHLGRDLRGAATDVLVDRPIGGPELAGNHDQLIGDQRLAGHLGRRFARQEGIEDGVRNLVGEFVGMAFRNRLRGGGEGDWRHY